MTVETAAPPVQWGGYVRVASASTLTILALASPARPVLAATMGPAWGSTSVRASSAPTPVTPARLVSACQEQRTTTTTGTSLVTTVTTLTPSFIRDLPRPATVVMMTATRALKTAPMNVQGVAVAPVHPATSVAPPRTAVGEIGLVATLPVSATDVCVKEPVWVVPGAALRATAGRESGSATTTSASALAILHLRTTRALRALIGGWRLAVGGWR